MVKAYRGPFAIDYIGMDNESIISIERYGRLSRKPSNRGTFVGKQSVQKYEMNIKDKMKSKNRMFKIGKRETFINHGLSNATKEFLEKMKNGDADDDPYKCVEDLYFSQSQQSKIPLDKTKEIQADHQTDKSYSKMSEKSASEF